MHMGVLYSTVARCERNLIEYRLKCQSIVYMWQYCLRGSIRTVSHAGLNIIERRKSDIVCIQWYYLPESVITVGHAQLNIIERRLIVKHHCNDLLFPICLYRAVSDSDVFCLGISAGQQHTHAVSELLTADDIIINASIEKY